MEQKQIISTYNVLKSIKGTAKQLHISEGVVKKALIQAGLIENDLTREIKEKIASGMSQAEIAEEMGISTTKVNIYAPYTKCSYLSVDKSENARRIINCRTKKAETKNQE